MDSYSAAAPLHSGLGRAARESCKMRMQVSIAQCFAFVPEASRSLRGLESRLGVTECDWQCGEVRMSFSSTFINETIEILSKIDQGAIEKLANGLAELRAASGRLFILGVGGSAGHASHAVNDFRKICGIEAYAPTDNVSELTARTNDEGWETTFSEWLKVSRFAKNDALLIFSVGGGNLEKNVSPNLVRSIQLARQAGGKVFGIVGRDGGYTAQAGDAVVVIPPLVEARITPHTEGLCAVVWHLLVSHPAVKVAQTKWESVVKP